MTMTKTPRDDEEAESKHTPTAADESPRHVRVGDRR